MTTPRRNIASTATAVILLAAGRGTRMRGAVDDKILAPLAGRPVFSHSVAAFIAAGFVSRFLVVYRDAAQRAQLARLMERGPAREWPVDWVRGGRERRDSVALALTALGKRRDVGFVCIHDCARPLVHVDALRAVHEAARRDGAACLAHRVTDTIKQLPKGAADARRRRLKTIDRARLWAMETPQAFAFSTIARAYAEVRRRGLVVTDDAAALELTSRRGMTLVENLHANPKITRPADLAYAEFLLAAARQRA
jgi:2-C-methyl-D-erythritol 4-phosphate cytidylyltransferase